MVQAWAIQEYQTGCWTHQTLNFCSGDTPLDLLLHWHDNYEDKLDMAEELEPVDEEEEHYQVALCTLIPTCSHWWTLDIKPTVDSLDLLTMLNKPLNNLKSVHFSSDPPAILYKLFKDEKPFVVFSNALALKTVTLNSQKPFMLPVPWSQLTSYHLLDYSAGACLWLIQQCIKLVKCTVVISDLIKITHLLTNTHYLTSNCGQSKFLTRPTFPKSSTESLPLPLQNFACSMRSTSHLRRLQSQVYHLSSSDHPALSVTWSSHYWHSQHQSLWTFSSKCLCSLISGLVWTLYAKGISFSPQTCLKHWPDQDLLQTCCYQALHFSCHNWDHACLEVKWWMISLI